MLFETRDGVAAALAVAGIRGWRRGRAKIALVAIGDANLNLRPRLRYIAERGDQGTQREALLAVKIPEARDISIPCCGCAGTQRDRFQFTVRRRRTALLSVRVLACWPHGNRRPTPTLVEKKGYPLSNTASHVHNVMSG